MLQDNNKQSKASATPISQFKSSACMSLWHTANQHMLVTSSYRVTTYGRMRKFQICFSHCYSAQLASPQHLWRIKQNYRFHYYLTFNYAYKFTYYYFAHELGKLLRLCGLRKANGEKCKMLLKSVDGKIFAINQLETPEMVYETTPS